MAEYVDKEIAYAKLSIFGMNVQKMVTELPTANVKEIIYAHWICKPDCEVTECSHCHRNVEEYVEYPYCMYCGAEMSEVK